MLFRSADWAVPMKVSEDALSPAEWRVARLAVQGLSYKEIARELGRSPHTVDHQLRSIRSKLNVGSAAALVHLLASQGLAG